MLMHIYLYTALCLRAQDFNVTVVLEDGKRCGLITKGDVLVRIFGRLFEWKVDFCLNWIIFIL